MKLAASVLVLLSAACGDDGATGAIDAPIAIDAPAIDAAPLPVTFQLGAEFAAGTMISIADGAGTPTQLLATDVDGKASAIVAAGSSASIAGAQKLYVVLGLQPGDAVVLAKPHAQAQTTGKLSLVTSTLAGATSYDGTNGGAGETAGVVASTKVTVQVNAYDAYLAADGTYTMLARALTYPTVDGFLVAKHLAAPVGGATTIAMDQGVAWQTTLGAFPYTLDHVTGSGDHAEIYPSIEGNRYQAQVFGGSADGAGHIAGSIMVPADAAIDSYGVWVSFNTPTNGYIERYTRLAALGSFALDRATLLPDVTGATTTFATTPAVSITAAASLAGSVGTACELAYTSSAGMQAVAIAMPPATAATQTATLPALPAALAAYAPVAPYDGTLSACRAFAGDRYDAAAFRATGWYAATQAFDLFPPTSGTVLDFSAWYAP